MANNHQVKKCYGKKYCVNRTKDIMNSNTSIPKPEISVYQGIFYVICLHSKMVGNSSGESEIRVEQS